MNTSLFLDRLMKKRSQLLPLLSWFFSFVSYYDSHLLFLSFFPSLFLSNSLKLFFSVYVNQCTPVLCRNPISMVKHSRLQCCFRLSVAPRTSLETAGVTYGDNRAVFKLVDLKSLEPNLAAIYTLQSRALFIGTKKKTRQSFQI